jgi:hypothetical protein
VRVQAEQERVYKDVRDWLVPIVAVLGSACTLPYDWVGEGGGESFDSKGERIYFTGTSSSGETIGYSGGVTMMHHHAACVNCHGPDGRGGRVSMMIWWGFDAPDITWDHLSQEEHDEKEDHEEHPPYTEETLKRAIVEGLDPAGDPLSKRMPRWRMSENDLNDLVDFLKAL